MRSSGEFPVQLIDGPSTPRWSRAAVASWLSGEADMADQWFALLTMSEVAPESTPKSSSVTTTLIENAPGLA